MGDANGKPTFILLDATATPEEIVRAVRAAAGKNGGGDGGGPTPAEAGSRSLLLERAAELTGKRPELLVDSDGDVQLRDSPFGIWARISNLQGEGTAALVLVAIPLLELPATAEARDLVKRTLAGAAVEWQLATNAVHLFRPLPVSVLAKGETFGEAVAAMAAVGQAVVSAVQPRLGGLTAEQQRVLAGWRGRDEGTESLLLDIARKTGGRVLSHGWNPRTESPPLLVAEEDVPGGWANRFVTVDAEGALRFRSTVPEPRDGVPGHELTIQRLDAEAARTWATRLGVESRSGPLGVQEVRSLTGRRWTDLTAAFRDLPHDSGDGWQPASGS